jgi:antitoxin component YwqK of YwqJK toxin-antitoxin module
MNQHNNKGYREGYWEIDNREGNLLAKGDYTNGLKEGYWEEYYSNGDLVWKGHFKNNKPINFWKFYNRFSKLTQKVFLL